MKTQHTPGPWDLEPVPYPEESGEDGWYLHRGDPEEPLFLSADEVSPEHARLIASAPELLSALQQIVSNWHPARPSSPAFMDYVTAKEAIAKATTNS